MAYLTQSNDLKAELPLKIDSTNLKYSNMYKYTFLICFKPPDQDLIFDYFY